MDTTVGPPTAPVPFPTQFPNNGSPGAVAMLNFGRFTSKNIFSCSVHCLQCIIRLAYDVPLVSGALHGHYSLLTHLPGPFSSTIFVYMRSPELLQCTVLNFERFDAGNVEKPKRHTLTPAHRQPHTRVRFIDKPDAL